MTSSELASHLAFFAAYVDRFHNGDDADRANVDLKREHSLRVLDEARMITDSLGSDVGGGLVDLVHLAALYHDLGRFPQYERWRTFDDSVSANHGLLGLRALRESAALSQLPARARRVVQAAVALHNRRFVPPHLPRDIALALGVVRDADKLDIMRVMLAHLEPGAPANAVVTLGLADVPDAYTPDVLDQLARRRLASYSQMRYFNDFRLMLLSWVYDLNFAASRRAFVERGHLDALAVGLPDAPAVRGAVEQVRADLADAGPRDGRLG
ncbi:hypothetical protein GGQ74_000992 [Desulfobaculum xiamenense]|uniref:HD/PDEase domain-containing protein n=1 Tax=Desulfobaculum xiamenense TaxID=995050 RepID=A0A846QLL7_9BACT|nr:HD domain-containing protein [Desulfobaculum xiamenense]NJB67352.1 hypothetical protein [Desulfobaculum xiamenense]